MATLVSSYNPTTAGAVDARTADALSVAFVARPQAMSWYVRFQERGTILTAGRILQLSTSDTNPRLFLYSNAGLYAFTIVNLVGTSTTRTLGVAPAIGAIVELLATLTAAGGATLSQSLNGATATATASATVTLPPAWSGTTLTVNSISGGSNTGTIALLNLLIVRGVQDFPTMRRLAGVGAR